MVTVKLWLARLGMLCLVAASWGFGARGLALAFANRAPQDMECRDYLAALPKARPVKARGCRLQYSRTLWVKKSGAYFVPLRAGPEDAGPVRAYFRVRDSAKLAELRHPSDSVADALEDVEGFSETPFMARDAAYIRVSGTAPELAVLDPEDKPSWVWPPLLIAFGALFALLLAFSFRQPEAWRAAFGAS